MCLLFYFGCFFTEIRYACNTMSNITNNIGARSNNNDFSKKKLTSLRKIITYIDPGNSGVLNIVTDTTTPENFVCRIIILTWLVCKRRITIF